MYYMYSVQYVRYVQCTVHVNETEYSTVCAVMSHVDEHNQSIIRLIRHDIRTIVYTENMSLHVLRSLCMYVDRNDPTNTGWTKKDSNIN